MKVKMKKNILLFTPIVLLGIVTIFYVIYHDYHQGLKEEKTKYNIPIQGDIYAMILDGKTIDNLPTTNVYLVSYNCKNGSNVTWDRVNKKLSISKNTKVTEQCTLEFKTNPLLSEMKQGDYVSYVGNNGCMNGGTPVTGTSNAESGNSCLGNNANETLDTNGNTYGYCYSANYKYYVKGWRIAYIENGRSYLVSAGSPECNTIPYEEPESFTTTTASTSMGSSSYYYGTSYTFNSSTGKYTLSGTLTSGVWSSIYSSVIGQYTCKSTSSTGTCATIYKIESYESSTYAYTYNKGNMPLGNTVYISLANEKAKKYCNSSYVDGNCSDNSDSWAINDTDFNKMTAQMTNSTGGYLYTSISGAKKCGGVYSTEICGYHNDLIDNGGYYWFAAAYSASDASGVIWAPNFRHVNNSTYTNANGLRPIIRLSSNIYVTGGSGTMDNPYTIGY